MVEVEADDPEYMEAMADRLREQVIEEYGEEAYDALDSLAAAMSLEKDAEIQQLQEQLQSQQEQLASQAKDSAKVKSRLSAVEVSKAGTTDARDDFGHISAHVDSKTRAKAKRMNEVVEYMAGKSSESRNGKHSASWWEIKENVFPERSISKRTLRNYLRDIAEDVPGMKYGWPGEDVTNTRIDRNAGKRLKFDIERYAEETQ